VPESRLRFVKLNDPKVASVDDARFSVTVFNVPFMATPAGKAPTPLITKEEEPVPFSSPATLLKAPPIVKVLPFKLTTPAVWVNVPAMLRLETKVILPVAVRFRVKLLIVGPPVIARLPNAPEPPILKLDVGETTIEFELGVKFPFSVRVLAPTVRLPLVKVKFPPMVLFPNNEVPLELIITLTPELIGCPEPIKLGLPL